MTENQEQIERLLTRLDRLVKTQIDFQREVSGIRAELERLRTVPPAYGSVPVNAYVVPQSKPPEPPKAIPPWQTAAPETRKLPPPPVAAPNFGQTEANTSGFTAKIDSIKDSARSDFEKFIGENLLSKVGIVILIIGVAIGAKFAIDQGWISPLVRIIFGYVCGFALVGLAIRLKPKYITFSSVLISGGIAVLYFITYFAYSLYQLFNQVTAFAVMVVITGFAVGVAINYSRQIIAHLGLVGAYAIPFLLSDNSGNYAVLFTYIVIINTGILIVSLNRYWKPLFYTSFVVTWATFFGWYIEKFVDANHFGLAFTFAAIYFLTFYITFIAYKFRSGQSVAIENVGLILSNSSLFYAFGYHLTANHAGLEGYLGLFTIGNAAIHLVFAFVANKIRTVSIDFVYLLGALVLTFITISIPVQFSGQHITLAWTAEAVLLFAIGRLKPIPLYEYYSYPLIFIASVVLLQNFADHWSATDAVLSAAGSFPFFNSFFVTSIFYVAAFFLIFFVNRNKNYESPGNEDLRAVVGFVAAGAGTLVLYNAFRVQISDYFDFLRVVTSIRVGGFQDIPTEGSTYGDLSPFNILSQIDYTMLFLAVISVVNLAWFKSVVAGFVNLLFELLSLFVFMTVGLYTLSGLRLSYLTGLQDGQLRHGVINIGMRYLSYFFVAMVFVSIYRYLRSDLFAEYNSAVMRRTLFEMLMTVSMFFLLSSELLNWMDIFGQKDSYKLGLSIFWGVYSLVLVSLGIYFGRKHLRISAIVIFGITLVKLFIYDIEDLGTLGKTAVFVSLGVLMLIVSFLYHKYKGLIAESDARAFEEKS